MIGYVYKTTCLINNLIYIGQHISSAFDKNYYGSGKNFMVDFKKYGRAQFTCELLEACESLDALNEAEKYWIDKLNSRDPAIGYNIAFGGQDGCFIGCKHSDNARIKISKSSKDRIWVYNIETLERRFIKQDEYQALDSSIWKFGHNINTFESKSAEELQAISSKISSKKLGKYYFTNKDTGECKMIQKDEILSYVANNYWYGTRNFTKRGYIWLTDGINDYKVYNRDYIGKLMVAFNLWPGRSTSGNTWPMQENVFSLDNSIITKQALQKPKNLRKTKPSVSHVIIDQFGKKHHSEITKAIIRQKRNEQKNINTHGTTGKIFYNNGSVCKMFFKGKQPEGFIEGRLLSDEARKKMSKAKTADNRSRKGKLNKTSVIKEGIIKCIGTTNLDKYLAEGYCLYIKGEKNNG